MEDGVGHLVIVRFPEYFVSLFERWETGSRKEGLFIKGKFCRWTVDGFVTKHILGIKGTCLVERRLNGKKIKNEVFFQIKIW